MDFGRNKGFNWFRLTAGWFALLLYAGACSPPGLALAMLVGSLDPNHQILSGSAERGGRLVLHHANACAPHHHGIAARALTFFAQPASVADPDHILQFSSNDTLKNQSRTPAPRPDLRPLPLPFHSCEFLAPAPEEFAPGSSLSLPDRDVACFCQRSTVLLI